LERGYRPGYLSLEYQFPFSLDILVKEGKFEVMNHDSNKYADDFSRFQKRQKIADDEPQAYAAADENSSDSDDEVKSFISSGVKSKSRYLHEGVRNELSVLGYCGSCFVSCFEHLCY
jgi:hypothetical protein